MTRHFGVENNKVKNGSNKKQSSMKNLIKIFSAILIIAIAIVAINCSTSGNTEGQSDSTAVVADTVVVVDTTSVSGGAGVTETPVK
jgi:hypothetical protein